MKPFLEGKDLKRWRAEPRGLWLIKIEKGWTRSRFNTSDEALAWASLSTNYPAIAAWLFPFAASAQIRTDKGEFWWELRACAYYEKFDAAKISYKDMADSAPFHVDTEGAVMANTGYFIPSGEHHLAAYLNSKLLWVIYLN